ncbi:hypothetical protein [Rappaport israeli]|uniref:hypothetical protein n=1 Tax=Rappaport israeli TaxID=1839807 RepID=UPI000930354B|nr:hypothetical protein [Rappaport israeli]
MSNLLKNKNLENNSLISSRPYWAFIAHPLAAMGWFLCALALTLWLGYLKTDQRYVLDLRLLFYFTAVMWALVWLLQTTLWAISKRYVFFPLLGIVSVFSLALDLSERAAYWFNFQLNQNWFEYVAFLLSVMGLLLLLGLFLRDFAGLRGRSLKIYLVMLAMPCVLMSLYLFLNQHYFYEYRQRHYPSYHQGLLPEKIDLQPTKSLQSMFD